MCEAQGHLALHGNKVSLLSDALMFVFLLPFCGPLFIIAVMALGTAVS